MNQEVHHAEDDFEGGLDAEAAGEQETDDTIERSKRNPENAEQQEAKELPSQAAAVHQRLRMDGQKELARGSMALLLSAVAAGISMSFSMVARGVMHAKLPDSDVGFLIECLGYTIGFIAVILARQQLFTENTVTAVLPIMSNPTRKNFAFLGRLWSVVLVGNLLGAALSAATFLYMPMFDAATHESFTAIGEHMMENSPYEMFAKAILAGWMIATLVWLIPAAGQAKVWVIIIITYVMAIGEFTHIVVGASEGFYLLLIGNISWSELVFQFGLPTLAGNVIGGTFIFALISHAQIRGDKDLSVKAKPDDANGGSRD
ncbi:formate/nitrite transporter family protein [Halomonas janggokensis]|uniref:Formate/nitrite transporter family protein n=1 Tax=Vreelandella janggokensis TaxID=370767 RepID=A0ABT4IRN8_9GAMM|nr:MULTISPECIES: formate/nitrite transporter family protein [Halomonas]MCW4153185.1 formate/nitrite transporter family protein [Halomonas sp. 18H]MCZ0925898.1 formate/nitrite transporter family protein [Halomonas janggokensis]MCZ0930965.1 formate/nitrite transporter family protein [Halomonas janggokensis]